MYAAPVPPMASDRPSYPPGGSVDPRADAARRSGKARMHWNDLVICTTFFLPTCGCTRGSSGSCFWEINRKRVLCFDIMAGPDEEDPFSDLRHTFEGDDRLDDSPVPSAARASAAALPRSTSTAPPPLPTRRRPAPVDRVSSNPLPRSQEDPF